MDAVQKTGNGHPGTAMSLAPVAYTLFQRVMRHDPADPDWLGRDRFVLSAGHSSLTLYIQLYLSGYGLELDDLKALRTLGLADPGPPGARAHRRGGDHHRSARPGRSATRSASRWRPGASAACSTRTRRPARASSTTGSSRSARTATWRRGVSGEASSLAGRQKPGNLTVIYDDNKISIEDDTNIALSEDVGLRYEAYGWHVQTIDWRPGRDLRRGRGRAGGRR